MTNLEFQEMLDKLEQGLTAELTKTVDGQTYTRVFLPENRLILLGGGHIAVPLCAMASMLDFAVTVLDDRISFANSERFPQAAQVICDSFAAGIARLQIRATDYVCVITRGHRWDGECLRQILSGTLPKYLGMIGSKRRVEGLLSLLAEEGFDPESLGRIHAPIGLKINAQTPAEIRRVHLRRNDCPQAAVCPEGFPHLPGPDQYRRFHAPVSGTGRPAKGLRAGAFLHRLYTGKARRDDGN